MTEKHPVFGKENSRFSSIGETLHDTRCVVDLLSAFIMNTNDLDGLNRSGGYDPLHGMSVLLDCIRNTITTAADSEVENRASMSALKDLVRACAADPAQPVDDDDAAAFLEKATALARQQKAAQKATANKAAVQAALKENMSEIMAMATADDTAGPAGGDAAGGSGAHEPEHEAGGDTYPRIGPTWLPAREAAIAATIAGGYSVKAVAQAVNMKKGAVERVAERLRGSGVLPPESRSDDARAAAC